MEDGAAVTLLGWPVEVRNGDRAVRYQLARRGPQATPLTERDFELLAQIDPALAEAARRQARQDTDTNPTEAQKSAGNYAKGELRWNGLTISLENPAGSVRSGVGDDGKPWTQTMATDYGYVNRSGPTADGEQLDIFLGPDLASPYVLLINQCKPTTGAFDEHKAVIGCKNYDEALATYHANYPPDWAGFDSGVSMDVDAFKRWLDEGDVQSPVMHAAYTERQPRARKGGEYGPNGEFYKGGAWIATGDMPKRARRKFEQIARSGERQELIGFDQDGRWIKASPPIGSFAIWERFVGRELTHHGEVNHRAMDSMGYAPEQRAEVEHAARLMRQGEHWASVREHPLTAPWQAVVRTLARGEAVPAAAVDRVRQASPELAAYVEQASAQAPKPTYPGPSAYLDEVDKITPPQPIMDMEDAYIGGVGDFGDKRAAYAVQALPGYFDYRSQLESAATRTLGDQFDAYRLMNRAELGEWRSGTGVGPVSAALTRRHAEAFKKFALNEGEDLVLVRLAATPQSIIMRGKSAEMEVVLDGDQISADALELLGSMQAEWREHLHPRHPKGTPQGGEWIDTMKDEVGQSFAENLARETLGITEELTKINTDALTKAMDAPPEMRTPEEVALLKRYGELNDAYSQKLTGLSRLQSLRVQFESARLTEEKAKAAYDAVRNEPPGVEVDRNVKMFAWENAVKARHEAELAYLQEHDNNYWMPPLVDDRHRMAKLVEMSRQGIENIERLKTELVGPSKHSWAELNVGQRADAAEYHRIKSVSNADSSAYLAVKGEMRKSGEALDWAMKEALRFESGDLYERLNTSLRMTVNEQISFPVGPDAYPGHNYYLNNVRKEMPPLRLANYTQGGGGESISDEIKLPSGDLQVQENGEWRAAKMSDFFTAMPPPVAKYDEQEFMKQLAQYVSSDVNYFRESIDKMPNFASRIGEKAAAEFAAMSDADKYGVWLKLQTSAEGDEDDEDHTPEVPTSWDELDDDKKSEAEEKWKELNHSSFMEGESESYFEEQAYTDAAYELTKDRTWIEEAAPEIFENMGVDTSKWETRDSGINVKTADGTFIPLLANELELKPPDSKTYELQRWELDWDSTQTDAEGGFALINPEVWKHLEFHPADEVDVSPDVLGTQELMAEDLTRLTNKLDYGHMTDPVRDAKYEVQEWIRKGGTWPTDAIETLRAAAPKDLPWNGFHQAEDYWKASQARTDVWPPYSPPPPEGQGALPGMPLPDETPWAHFEREISSAFKSAYHDAVEKKGPDMEFPADAYEDSVQESMADVWDQWDDAAKFDFVKNDSGLWSEFETTSEGETDGLREPGAWSAYGQDGKKLARELARRRTLEIAKERGIEMTMGDVTSIDNTVWSAWKGKSWSGPALALRAATAKELGAHEFYLPGHEEAAQAALAAHGEDKLRAYVRGLYETTQYILYKSGMNDLHLFRAIYEEKLATDKADKQTVDGYTMLTDLPLKQNALQSTTHSESVANNWGGVGTSHLNDPRRVVLRMVTPRESVLSLPVYGKNVHGEQEVVIAGLPWKRWEAWYDRAPSFEYINPLTRRGQYIDPEFARDVRK